MIRRVLLGAIVFAVACGGSSNSTPDSGGGGSGSGSGSGSAANTVMTVDCASATPVATVTTPTIGPSNFNYVSDPAGAEGSNSSDISVGDVVEFMPSSTHPVGPDAQSGMTDKGLVALDNKTTCLKFTAAGTFHYRCTEHGFKGIVNVSQ